MARPRCCRSCRRWFRPHPKDEDRQEYCSDPACQRERHRRACADWRRRNPDYDRQDRVRRRLVKDTPLDQIDPLRGIDWEAARQEVGVGAASLVEEAGKLILQWARDDIPA